MPKWPRKKWILPTQPYLAYSSLSNKREHQINMDMGQNLQINKRGQWNKRGNGFLQEKCKCGHGKL